jgi:hypothetical protein
MVAGTNARTAAVWHPTGWLKMRMVHSPDPTVCGDATGHILALHHSYDPRNAVRHAVSWEAITAFLAG